MSTSHPRRAATGDQAAADERAETIQQFKTEVNMTAGALEKWLRTPESKEVGQKTDENAESTGHGSGRQIVGLLRKKQADYTDADLKQMHRVVSYVRRHLAQGPQGDPAHTAWRYSLMNWGHDPLKKKG